MQVTISLTPEQIASLTVKEDQKLYGHNKIKIKEASDIYTYLEFAKGLSQECVVVVTLDIRNRIIDRHVISRGVLDACLMHPREVFRDAIMDNAAKIIIAHNHPSGEVTPSDDDITVTKRINTAGKVLGISLLDSVIVARGGGYSMQANGII